MIFCNLSIYFNLKNLFFFSQRTIAKLNNRQLPKIGVERLDDKNLLEK